MDRPLALKPNFDEMLDLILMSPKINDLPNCEELSNCLTHKKVPLKATFLDRQLVQVLKETRDHLVTTMENA